MVLLSTIYASIQSNAGVGFVVDRNYSAATSFNNVLHNPADLVLPALTTQAVSLGMLTDAQYLFIQTDQPIDVTLTTPITIANTPTPATFRINNVLLMTCDVTAITFFNPNNVAANIKITALGA